MTAMNGTKKAHTLAMPWMPPSITRAVNAVRTAAVPQELSLIHILGQRSAASIARRLQDPLAELVKIDPKSIGVGQYQHDMNQKKLGEQLSGVVEDAVNKVGVDLNTASASLLGYISGISKVIAQNIVTYREENGRFRGRCV